MNEVASLITNVGFPIAMCLILCYYISNEIKELRTTVENNTLVITKLVDNIDKYEGDK
jgi:hypothetical protein